MRHTLALAALLLACGGDDGDAALAADASTGGDGAVCEPFEARVCQSGDSFWVDSCGNVGELAEECLGVSICNDDRGLCCQAQGQTDDFAGQPWTTNLDFTHPVGTEASWTLELEDVDYVPSARGQVMFWRIPIGTSFARLGFATHIYQPGSGDYGAFGIYWIGEGVDDLADAEPDEGASETLGSIGTTIRYDLASTELATLGLRFVREEAEGEGDWFALYASIDGASEIPVGRMRFDRVDPGLRLTLADYSTMSIQVGKVDPELFTVLDLPTFRVALSKPTIDGAEAGSASVRYGTVGSPPFVASEVYYREADDKLVFSHGMGAMRCGGAGPVF